MKIKIIDMLVKIANREENTNVKTKYDSVNWDKKDFLLSIYNEFGERNNDEIVEFLNDYVEIIEEPKKIEKLPYYSLKKIQKSKSKDEWYEKRLELLEKRINDYHNKINELIDEINNLKEK